MDLRNSCSNTCPCCPHNVKKTCPHTSTEEVLKSLCRIVSNDDGCLLIDRQLILINHLLGISEGRIKLPELKYLTVVLEFLCERLETTPKLLRPLKCLLGHCRKPPLMTSRSEAIAAEDVLSEYLTGIGNCLIVVKDSDIKNLLIDVLYNFLSKRELNDAPENVCLRSLDKSKIGDKLAQLIYTAEEQYYEQILDLTLKYAILSKNCAKMLLNSDVIYFLLSRLEQQQRPYNLVKQNVIELTSSIIRRLLSCLEKKKFRSPLNHQKEIIEFLRKWLREEVSCGNPQTRNDVTAIISRILYAFPADGVLTSGIFEDISLLAFATEFEIKHSWAKNVKFPPTLENLNFKKLLVLIICAMLKDPGMRTVSRTYNHLPGMALLLGTGSGESETRSWPETFKRSLILHVLHALPAMAQYLPDRYLASGATQRILELLQCSIENPNDQTKELTKCSLHCLNSLIFKGICPEHFIQSNTVNVVLDVALRLLEYPLTLINQLILSHCFILLSNLSKCSIPRTDFHLQVAKLGLTITKRLLKPDPRDSKLDGSLSVTAVDFIRHSIVRFYRVRKMFTERGGVYLLLDLAKMSSMPVQVLLLVLLADISEDIAAIPQLVTWRGNTENDTVLALLSHIWRKQEALKGVKRDRNGCICESEAILEGEAQTGVVPSWKYCPAVAEMEGCARPKIYAIFYNIIRRYYAASNAAMQQHGVDIFNLTYQDEITVDLINNYEYFKRGEVWKNLWLGLSNLKLTLLPQIETSLFILSKTYMYIAGNIALRQQNIAENELNKGHQKEKELYDNIRSAMRTEALNSFMVIRNDLYNNNTELNRQSKLKTEEGFMEMREKMDIDILVPEYHRTRLVRANYSEAHPSTAFRIRKNSKLLESKEYLNPSTCEKSAMQATQFEESG